MDVVVGDFFDAVVVNPLALPEGAFGFLEKLGVDFLLSGAGSFVTPADGLDVAGRQIAAVVVGRAGGEGYVFPGGEFAHDVYGLRGGGDDALRARAEPESEGEVVPGELGVLP